MSVSHMTLKTPSARRDYPGNVRSMRPDYYKGNGHITGALHACPTQNTALSPRMPRTCPSVPISKVKLPLVLQHLCLPEPHSSGANLRRVFRGQERLGQRWRSTPYPGLVLQVTPSQASLWDTLGQWARGRPSQRGISQCALALLRPARWVKSRPTRPSGRPT